MLQTVFLMIYAVAIASSQPSSQPDQDYSIEPPKNPATLFNAYIKINRKEYGSLDEYHYRAQIFFENLKKVLGSKVNTLNENLLVETSFNGPIIKIKDNQDSCKFEMSLNKFSDLSNEEFKKYYLLPPEFFDEKKYNPTSKILSEADGKQVIVELDKSVDPIEEVFDDDKNPMTRYNEISHFKNVKNFNNQVQVIYKAIFELKIALTTARERMELAKLNKPDDDGLTPLCRRILNIKASILKGTDNVNSTYSKIPSGFDFSKLFEDRKLQSIDYAPKYLEQSFESYKNIDGVQVPSYLNWNQITPLTPVKDQMKCNACYIFSATSALEAHNAILNEDWRTISEQEILDCSNENNGCYGGQPYLVFDYVINNGLSFDKYYSYSGKQSSCKAGKNSQTRKFKNLKGYVFPKPGVLNLIKALQYGPVAIVMYASDHLKYYYDGIYEGQGCFGGETPNHSALVYGYNLDSKKPYFMLKNGWGTVWGDNGHYKVAIGKLSNSNTGYCQMAETRFNVIPVLKR